MATRRRGIVLVHVLILVMLLAWLAAMFLKAMLSRQTLAHQAMSSNEARDAMAAATNVLTSCFAGQNLPKSVGGNPPSCAQLSGACAAPTVGAGSTARFTAYSVCGVPANPPCKIRITVCPPNNTACTAVPCS